MLSSFKSWCRRYVVGLTFISLLFTVCVSNIVYRNNITLSTPPDKTPTYAMGNASDYHQYLAIINLGRHGHFLYHHMYSELQLPDILLQPVYTMIGLLTAPFPFTLADTYFVFHLISLIFLTITIYDLIKQSCKSTATRWLAIIFFFSSTGYWWIKTLQPFSISPIPLPDFNFNLFQKYLSIPPHHNIAIAIVIIIVLMFPKRTIKSFITVGILFVLLGLIHPYIQLVLFYILGTEVLISVVLEKKIFTHTLRRYVGVLTMCIPFIVYTVCVYINLKFSVATDGIFTILPRSATTVDYFLSLGPLFIMALPSLFIKKIRNNPNVRLIILWAYVPVLLFYFPDFKLPIATWRLFQIYQHIPLAVLSSLSLYYIIPKKHYSLVIIILGCISLIYGATIFLVPLKENFSNELTDIYINYFIPNSLIETYAFLDHNTPKNSVVLGGEFVSVMMPQYSHNRVIIGHQGNNRDYYTKLTEMNIFFSETETLSEAINFLHNRHISYIIFGMETKQFIDTAYAKAPMFKEIYHNSSGISVVQVIR